MTCWRNGKIGRGAATVLWTLIAFGVALGTGCRTQSVPYQISGGNGSSREQAVIIKARNIAFGTSGEVAWLKDHCANFQAITNRFEAAGIRIYSVVTLASTNGQTRLVYFDLTDPIRNSPRQP